MRPNGFRFLTTVLTILAGTAAYVLWDGSVVAAPRHLHSGDELSYVGNAYFNIPVYGTHNPDFDDEAGKPVDSTSISVHFPQESLITIIQVKSAPDGSDAWYDVWYTVAWYQDRPNRGWMRAADVNSHHEDSIENHQQKPVMSAEDAKSLESLSLDKEKKVTTEAFLSAAPKAFFDNTGHARDFKPGETCEVSGGAALMVPVRSGPSLSSPLEGFLDNGSAVTIADISNGGWWRVSYLPMIGGPRQVYAPEWLITNCAAPKPYAEVHRYELRAVISG